MGNKRPSEGLAIVSLILNILVLPGLGSLIGGKTTAGILQLVFTIFAVILDFTIIGLVIGLPLGLAMWIWALITGIQIVKEVE